jgi:hypothetical protein
VYGKFGVEYHQQTDDDSDRIPDSWEQVGGVDIDCNGESPYYYFQHTSGSSDGFPHHVIITSRQRHGIDVVPQPVSPCLWCPQ